MHTSSRRRSSRLAGKTVSYREELVSSVSLTNRNQKIRTKREREDSGPETPMDVKVEQANKPHPTKPQSLTSQPTAKSTVVNVSKILERYLGRKMDSSGKAPVVRETVNASQPKNEECPGYFVSFNKYSGVCEWRNEAIFLWVNMGNKDSDVNNEFLEGGRLITWFGGSRMHEQSPVMQRLLNIGKRAARNDLSTNDGIILWCRLFESTKRGFGPYVCMGRVGYHSHFSNTHPLKFIWCLLDYDKLISVHRETCQGKSGTIFEQLSNTKPPISNQLE
uniref:Uncharacterized protein n=1 Tax=Trieres chinensis TaxID=1514140 RepID=A0A7S2EEJ7_TRICV